MASGLPDYLKGVRPRHGGARELSSYVEIEKNKFNTLLEIHGKGMVYGGLIMFESIVSQKKCMPFLIVDKVASIGFTFEQINNYKIDKPTCYPLVELRYDDTNYIYSVGIAYGITFESGIVIKYWELEGGEPAVNCSLVYALIG